MSDMNGQSRGLVGLNTFEQLDPPGGQLLAVGLQVADAEPPTDKTPPSIDGIREAVRQLLSLTSVQSCLKQDALSTDCHMTIWHHSSRVEEGAGHSYLERERRQSEPQQLLWY